MIPRTQEFIENYSGTLLHPHHFLLTTARRNLIQFLCYRSHFYFHFHWSPVTFTFIFTDLHCKEELDKFLCYDTFT